LAPTYTAISLFAKCQKSLGSLLAKSKEMSELLMNVFIRKKGGYFQIVNMYENILEMKDFNQMK
jgi:hypothetical protein